MSITALAARRVGAPLESFSYEPDALGALDVELRISCCGICHSDVHLLNGEWGMNSFPFVPGHEIVGHVTAMGSSVGHLHLGQRVGIGWQCAACFECEYCMSGNEHHCAAARATCVGGYGGFADRIRVDHRFAFPLPDSMLSEAAAPLMCAGLTAYAPLRRYGVNASMRLGVIGIGGLGHLAVQFAQAMGCEVFAFSSSPEKSQEAHALGAHHFIATSESGAMAKWANTMDFILSTVSAPIELGDFVKALRKGGCLCLLAAPGPHIQIPAFPLMMGHRTVCGSSTGSRQTMHEMLRFSVRHDIQVKAEVLSMQEANAGLQRVREGKARYRVVLRN